MDKQTNECLKLVINKHLNTNCEICIFDELKSTNTTLKQMANQGANEGTIIIAHKQTEGRGTQGRKFYSPLNGLYISMLVRPKFDAKTSLYLTVATSVAIVDAIKKVTGIKCGIKWVNDIICNNKKVGGILTEAGFNNNSNTLDYAIVGVGLNLSTPQNGFLDELKSIAGALFDDKMPTNLYCKLVAEIINRTFKLYKQLDKKRYIKKYQKYSTLNQREVTFIQNGKTYVGVVDGIDNDANLIVKLDNKIIKLSSGEVKLLT